MKYLKNGPVPFCLSKQIIDKSSLSTRSMDRVAKVARTIPDLAEEDYVQTENVQEAAEFIVGGTLLIAL